MLTGCFRPSNKEILDRFNEFTTMFPTEDLTVLYDKEPENSEYLQSGDLGTWIISSYLYTEDKKDVGIVLNFNRNTRTAKGELILSNVGKSGNYPVYYDKDGIHLVDENVDGSIKKELSNFNNMYNFISLDKDYLNNLKDSSFSYNGNVPMYGVKYKLTSDDKNIKKIKEIYPEVPVDENNMTMSLSANGTTWGKSSMLSLEISLDEGFNNRFVSYMKLGRSNSLKGAETNI